MPLNVLIVPDKFKGTLSAAQAANAIASGWRQARPADRLTTLPMSDGGDGFGSVIGRLLGAAARTTRTVDAAGRSIRAQWQWDAASRTAIIESAAVIGIARLPTGKFHPFQLDTFGLGAVLQAAAAAGARRCIIGLGGTATNDGGFGMLRALGWQFLDGRGKPLTSWTALRRLTSIRPPLSAPRFDELVAAADVANPLLGPKGATRVFGPQKGLEPRELARAEERLAQLARFRPRTHAREAGAGAAGGLGFALGSFLKAQVRHGFQVFCEFADLKKRLARADLVITGEGCFDQQSMMGKGVGEMVQLCREANIPVLIMAGAVGPRKSVPNSVAHVVALSDLTSSAEARRHAASWLRRLAARAASEDFSAAR